MNRITGVIFVVLLMVTSSAYGDWEYYETTEVKGTISGTIKKDTIIQLKSGSIYQVSDRTRQRVRERNPETIVLRDGKKFKLIIDGFDEPLVCVQLAGPGSKNEAKPEVTPKVVESEIDGDFEGWEGETIFKLANGQIWQQSKYAYTYHYAYSPDIIIINIDGVWKMKVEDVDEMIEVKRLK
jgi:hypothetical protein